MAAPTNISAATAVDVGTLPASITQTVDDSGTTYSVWYSLTTGASDVVISVLGYGDAAVYLPKVSVYLGPVGAPVIYSTFSLIGPNLAIQFPVTPSTTYYLKFTTNAVDPSPAVLHLAVKTFAQQAVPEGALAVNDDADDFPLAILSPTDGSVLKFVTPFPAGEAGDILTNGITAWQVNSSAEVSLYDATFSLITTLSGLDAASNFGILRTCLGTQRFWVATVSGGIRRARSIAADGTLGTEHQLTAIATVGAIAASNDESLLYHVPNTTNGAVRVWDLLTDTASTDLVAGRVGYQTADILVLSDDTLLVSYIKTSATIDVEVIHYSAAGATLHTYNFGSAHLFPGSTLPRLAYGQDDSSFWIWTHPSGGNSGKSQFQEIEVSSGSALRSFLKREYELGVYQGTATATPDAFFGHSFSCPFVVLRSSSPPTPPDNDLNGPGGLEILRDSGRLVSSPIRRVRITPHVFDKNQRIFTRRLELLTAPGQATTSGQGSDPIITLHVSNDGGETYPIQRTLTTGQLGQYLHRCYTHQLGQARDRVYKFICTDPVTSVWIAVDVEIEEGTN